MTIATTTTGTGAALYPSAYRLRCYQTLSDFQADTGSITIRQGDAGEAPSGVLELSNVAWGPIGTSRNASVRLARGGEVSEDRYPFVGIEVYEAGVWRRVWAGRVQKASRQWFTPGAWWVESTQLDLLGLHSLYENDLIPTIARLSWTSGAAGIGLTRYLMGTATIPLAGGETYASHWQKQLGPYPGGEYGTGADLYNVAGIPGGPDTLVVDQPDAYRNLTDSGQEWTDYSTAYYSAQGDGWAPVNGSRGSVPDYVPRKAVQADIANPFSETVVSPWNPTATFSVPFNSFTNLTGWNTNKVHGWDGHTPVKFDGRTSETVSAIWRGELTVSDFTPYTSTDGSGNITYYFPTIAIKAFRGNGSGGWTVFANGSETSSPPSKFYITANGVYPLAVQMPSEYVQDGGDWRVIVEFHTPGLPSDTPALGSMNYVLSLGSGEGQPEYRQKVLNTTPDSVAGLNAPYLAGPTFSFDMQGILIPPLQFANLPPATGAGNLSQYAGSAVMTWPQNDLPSTSIQTAYMPRKAVGAGRRR